MNATTTSKGGAAGADAAAGNSGGDVTEFQRLLADLDDLVGQAGALTGDELARVRARLQDRIAAAKSYGRELAGATADQARRQAAAADDYVHAQPWMAIGIGAATGMVIGLLIGRRL